MGRGTWLAAVSVCAVCVACGARSDIDELSPGVMADASTVLEASTGSSEASLADVQDAPSGEPDAACSMPSVDVVDLADCPGNTGPCCKFSVTWTCRDVTYEFEDGCGPALDQLGCVVNGQPPAPSSSNPVWSPCSCKDTAAMIAFAEANCGPSSHP